MLLQIINSTVPKANTITSDITVVKDWFTPMLIAGAIIFAGIVIQRIIIIYIQRIAKKTHWKGGLVLVSSLRGMILLVSILFAVYFGMAKAPVDEQAVILAHKIHKVLLVFLITFVVARVLTGLLKAYSNREDSSKSSLSLFKSIINILVYTLGLLVMLESFGISITPVLTALGVGGLAVALALQDTLSNLFAGIQITLTRTIKPGDYIHLTTGEEGTVLDITWRSTTLLTQSDNMTVIPNSKLATTIITNYSLPKRNLSISVPVSISYDSDLDMVERITIEIGETLMKENGIESKPVFRYKELGNSSINFTLSMDINEFSQQYILRHEFIKRLYKRFKTEGIEIPYPATNVYLKKEN
ncbi:MAG TPA: mechanosensitive ion channel family protein [Bacteroidia bacterium]|nr:mechanosensitive ion channel family protein [Bacteroidia bacterium]